MHINFMIAQSNRWSKMNKLTMTLKKRFFIHFSFIFAFEEKQNHRHYQLASLYHFMSWCGRSLSSSSTNCVISGVTSYMVGTPQQFTR
mmetsp:Transcript_20346/g.46162  ORF Transcript_20346/g.46162 Transcript_20346/m.46162 type:complete len:88 (+) Transcript_20346:1909-2172(+)